VTQIDRFSLAGSDFTNVTTEFSLDPKGGASELHAGSIGSGLLSNFVVTFEMKKSRKKRM